MRIEKVEKEWIVKDLVRKKIIIGRLKTLYNFFFLNERQCVG